MNTDVWIIMPVYNEQECVEAVVNEWLEEMRKYSFSFTFCVLNDGSSDKSLEILNHLSQKNNELYVVDKPNSGHGQTCITGYQTAIEKGAKWIFQIDSDGQCDPAYFKKVWESAASHPVVFGYRKKRDDGFQRFLVSRIVSYFVFLATGVWVRDANVPYRLMNAEALSNSINRIPADFHLANIPVSVNLQKNYKIKWVNIHFRERMGGSPSVKTSLFAKHGITLFKQLRKITK
jgi:glycosyltransferase involved in cell wall biosynthesis